MDEWMNGLNGWMDEWTVGLVHRELSYPTMNDDR